jgi:hypothetical protein
MLATAAPDNLRFATDIFPRAVRLQLLFAPLGRKRADFTQRREGNTVSAKGKRPPPLSVEWSAGAFFIDNPFIRRVGY